MKDLDTSSQADLARELALYMQDNASAFYQSLDEFFRVGVLTKALRDRHVNAVHMRRSFSNVDDWNVEGVVNAIEIEDFVIGPCAETSWVECLSAQAAPAEAGYDLHERSMVDALSYAKENSSFRQDLLDLAHMASAWLDAYDLSKQTPTITRPSSSFRL